MAFWKRRKRTPPPQTAAVYLGLILALLAFKAGALWLMGRPLGCECGQTQLWYGGTSAAGNSQHLADWYSASHVIFGMLFYWVMWKTSRHWSAGWMFVAATFASVGWELAENTSWVIAIFADGLAQSYSGDSILNSLGDSLFTLAGFWLAMRAPIGVTIAAAAGMELAALAAVHDGFLLTLFLLLYPAETVLAWQGR
jgi:hypothetical protein